MALDALRKLGLSDGEIKVYSTLSDLGRCTISSLHEKVGFQRRSLYDILTRLIEKGLITYVIENKKKFFQISHPTKILGYIEEKVHDLENTKIKCPSTCY